MPQNPYPCRDRPLAGQSDSTSAAFAFATESPQHAQPPPPNNGGSVNSGSNETSAVTQPSNQPSKTTKPTSNENVRGPPAVAISVQNQLDQLESEVIHYMNVSMEEKEKSEDLSVRLDSVTQEKKDLERQVDELDEQLSRDGWPNQIDGASASEAGNTISSVTSKIARLKISVRQMKNNLEALEVISDERAKTIAELQEQLHNKKQQLVQKTQEEDRLRKELASMKETLKSQKKNYDNLLSSMRALEQQCNGVRAWREDTSKKLAESEKIRETLSGLLKQKNTELEKFQKEPPVMAQDLQQLLDRKKKEIEGLLTKQNDLVTQNGLLKKNITELEHTQKAGAAQAQNLHQSLARKQKEIESLEASQKDLLARCKQAEAISLQASQTITQLQAQLASRPKTQPVSNFQSEPAAQQQELHKRIEDLTKALERNQQRRMRAVGIGIDLSGSAAGSLENGVKRVYAHLLDTLEHSPCQTYVMTVIHGPNNGATITSNFSDDWAVHKRALDGKKAFGADHHAECLRKIKDAAANTGLVLDLQVVLIGDCEIDDIHHSGAEEVCSQFLSSNPPVRIHSVGVKTGAKMEWKASWGGMKAYVEATGGNMVLWFQNNELPDLSELVH